MQQISLRVFSRVFILTTLVAFFGGVLLGEHVGSVRTSEEWREAAMPVFENGDITRVPSKDWDEMTPTDLGNALNPCFKAKPFTWEEIMPRGCLPFSSPRWIKITVDFAHPQDRELVSP